MGIRLFTSKSNTSFCRLEVAVSLKTCFRSCLHKINEIWVVLGKTYHFISQLCYVNVFGILMYSYVAHRPFIEDRPYIADK